MTSQILKSKSLRGEVMKERGGGQHCVTGKGGPSQADGNSLDVMGAIAQGVEAKCDLLTGYLRWSPKFGQVVKGEFCP